MTRVFFWKPKWGLLFLLLLTSLHKNSQKISRRNGWSLGHETELPQRKHKRREGSSSNLGLDHDEGSSKFFGQLSVVSVETGLHDDILAAPGALHHAITGESRRAATRQLCVGASRFSIYSTPSHPQNWVYTLGCI